MSVSSPEAPACNWLCAGQDVFPAMLAEIEASQSSVRLEVYIFSPDRLGIEFREALVRAALRKVKVQVLVDALGSSRLPADFWRTLTEAGGEAKQFNPLALKRLGIRNHRKLLVCDERVAFVGGFNIAPEYEGDGVVSGWCDLGVRLTGTLVPELAHAFDGMFARAELKHKRFLPLYLPGGKKRLRMENQQLLLSGPGRGWNPIKRSLRIDMAKARDVRIIAAYFLPTWRIRRDLIRIARRGGNVELILPAKSDVLISQLAARSLYRRLLKAGVRIYEYQPQILHAKLVIIDDTVYVGSANLDQRSLNINYELVVRFQQSAWASEARKHFLERREHSREITKEAWRETCSLWQRFKQRWAYFLLVRIDPFIARWQIRGLPD
jgi:cardiolipin synthase